MSEHVAGREEAVRATSMGEQWLAEAQQEVLVEEEDRPLTIGERARAVETVEGRLETDLSRRESAIAATSSGPALLQEAFGERLEGDAPLIFSARERGLEGVEQRVDEALRTQEDALRAIPPGKQYLSEVEQVRAAGAAGPLALADRESMVRAVAQQVGEELDRREEELRAIISGDALLVEAAGALFGDGRTRSLGERWEACEGATSGVEEELDRREAEIRADPAAEEFLRDARLEVLGAADREAAALGDRARIVKAAAERRREAERRAHVGKREEALRATSLGGRWLDEAHQRALAGADRELAVVVRQRIADAIESRFASDLARREASLAATASGLALLREEYGEAGIADPPRSFLRRERVVEQGEWEAKRDARFEELGKKPGGTDLFHAHLADLDPAWDRDRNNTSTNENIDAALTAAESDDARQKRLRGVLSDESDAACYEEVLDQVVGQFKTSDLDRALAAGEKARDERELQQWREKRDARVDALANLPGGLELFHAHLADRDPKWGVNGNTTSTRENIDAALTAAESDDRRLKRLRGVLSDEADAARYREELDRVTGQFTTSDLDRVLDTVERERDERELQQWREKRDARVDALANLPGGLELFHAHLADRDPKWGVNGNTTSTRENIDAALTAAESDDRRLKRLRGVLSDEVAADRYREVLADSPGQFKTADLDRALVAGELERAEREVAAAATAARQQRWNAIEAFPGAQDAARAQFDRLEPSRTEKDVSPQCFDQVLDDVEQRIPKSLDVREASRRKGPNFSYEHGRHYDELLEQARTKVLGAAATERATRTLQQHAQVLDEADLLDGIERVVVYAQRLGKELLGGETQPAHDTLRTALRTTAAETGHADPRWKQIAEAAATDISAAPDPGLAGERAAIEQNIIESDRQRADRKADFQHQEDLDTWNALGRLRKAVTPEPERQEPEEPAPPSQARIDEYRQETLIRRIVQKIRDVLDYFLARELTPADQAAARAFNEQPREREPRQPEHDPGHYRGR